MLFLYTSLSLGILSYRISVNSLSHFYGLKSQNKFSYKVILVLKKTKQRNQGTKNLNHNLKSTQQAPSLPKVPWAKLNSFEVWQTYHLRAPSHLQPCRVQPGGSLYLDSSGKAQTAFWSEELEKAGEEKMRTAWRSAAAQTKALSTPSASRVGYTIHKRDKGKCRAGLAS